jgi:hypothetical protein
LSSASSLHVQHPYKQEKNTAKNKIKKRIYGDKSNQKLLELIKQPGQTRSKLPAFFNMPHSTIRVHSDLSARVSDLLLLALWNNDLGSIDVHPQGAEFQSEDGLRQQDRNALALRIRVG